MSPPLAGSSAPCARTAATWRLVCSTTHRGHTVLVHQLSWGHCTHWSPTRHGGMWVMGWNGLAGGGRSISPPCVEQGLGDVMLVTCPSFTGWLWCGWG